MSPKIGLVLSGGGVRGFAHAGVLKVLEKHRIKVTAIAGTSMGSIIGAMYASGLTAAKIEELILNFRLQDLFRVIDLSFSNKGFVRGEKILKYFMTLIKAKRFEELKIPLVVNAVDIISEKEIIFRKGDLSEALSASTCFPGVFEPKIIKDKLMMDGGLQNPLALGLLKKYNLDFSILVNVTTGFSKEINWEKPSVIDIFKQSINIMQDELIKLRLNTTKEDYILIQPDVGKTRLWDIRNSRKIINMGEKAALNHIKEVKQKIKHYSD
ncbi:patatin-like phospholipase family protein [Candidatus Woesearchaeota archaeon]|nr:patatin-like phospholipase family protein [Candidatus Woesearchaeota archaeon]